MDCDTITIRHSIPTLNAEMERSLLAALGNYGLRDHLLTRPIAQTFSPVLVHRVAVCLGLP